MNVYYSDIPPAVNELRPLPLPRALQRYLNDLLDLTKAYGYVFAEVDYLAKEWGVKPWKVYYIVRKLRKLGYFFSCRALHTGEWRLWPAAVLVKKRKPAEKAPAPQKSWADVPPERQEFIRQLVDRGVNLSTACAITEPYKNQVAKPAIQEWSDWIDRKGIENVKHLAASAEKALREAWGSDSKPEQRVIKAPKPATGAAPPAPAPTTYVTAPPRPDPLPAPRDMTFENLDMDPEESAHVRGIIEKLLGSRDSAEEGELLPDTPDIGPPGCEGGGGTL